jgi:hypothetical protein
MQGGQAEVDDLSEILVDGVDSLAAGGSDPRPQAVDDLIDFLRCVFARV